MIYWLSLFLCLFIALHCFLFCKTFALCYLFHSVFQLPHLNGGVVHSCYCLWLSNYQRHCMTDRWSPQQWPFHTKAFLYPRNNLGCTSCCPTTDHSMCIICPDRPHLKTVVKHVAFLNIVVLSSCCKRCSWLLDCLFWIDAKNCLMHSPRDKLKIT